MIHFAQFLHTYGYVAIAVGALFEGEFSMIAGGALAAAGILNFWAVIEAGLLGVVMGDLGCFLIGRYMGHRAGAWFPNLFARLQRAFALMDDYEEKLVVYFQFFPAGSTATPMAFGMTRIPLAKFLGLDVAGGVVWSALFGGFGLLVGRITVSAVHSFALWLAAGVGLAVVTCLVLRFYRTLRQSGGHKLWSAPAAPTLSGTGTSV
ncbi:MAG TPA: VTT domain-containing protein [Opitutaceae bacterium]|jgi:membrane protein DedA with SNARE-associated domain